MTERPTKPAPEDIDLLHRAMGRFNQAADSLSGYYERLSQDVANLNFELEARNRHLTSSLEEQRRSRKFLSSLLDHMSTGVAVLNADGRVVLANKSALLMLAADADETRQCLTLTPIRIPEAWPETIRRTIRQGHEENAREITICEGPGGRLLSTSMSPFFWPGDEAGGTGVIALIEDITGPARISAHRERTQTLIAMGDMAAQIAHQIRNPLGGIELFASILGREVSGDENLSRLVEHVLGGVKQVNHLINNYLILANPTKPVKSLIQLDRVMKDALAASAQSLEQNRITVRVRREQNLPDLEADPGMISQVFVCLILNAVEALLPGDHLLVNMKARKRGVEISFTDTGQGIETDNLGRIFNPFFTTKEQDLGLGLAVSHRIVDAHNGLIQVQSRVGQGTTVTITLPALPLPGENILEPGVSGHDSQTDSSS